MVERINAISKCKYELSQSYGRTRVIVKIPNSAGCIDDVTYNLPKRELESVLSGMVKYLELEARENYHIQTCEHVDRLNHQKELYNKSVTHEVDDRKWCSACGEIKQ